MESSVETQESRMNQRGRPAAKYPVETVATAVKMVEEGNRADEVAESAKCPLDTIRSWVRAFKFPKNKSLAQLGFYTVGFAAKKAGVNIATPKAWAKRGYIREHRLFGTECYERSQFIDFLDRAMAGNVDGVNVKGWGEREKVEGAKEPGTPGRINGQRQRYPEGQSPAEIRSKKECDRARRLGLLTTKQAADFLECTTSTIARQVREGKIQASVIGEGKFPALGFEQSELDRVLARKKRIQAALKPDAPTAPLLDIPSPAAFAKQIATAGPEPIAGIIRRLEALEVDMALVKRQLAGVSIR